MNGIVQKCNDKKYLCVVRVSSVRYTIQFPPLNEVYRDTTFLFTFL